MSIVRKLETVQETPHPFLENVGMRTLYSKRDDDAEITCFVVRCKAGSEIEEHLHQRRQILYMFYGGRQPCG